MAHLSRKPLLLIPLFALVLCQCKSDETSSPTKPTEATSGQFGTRTTPAKPTPKQGSQARKSPGPKSFFNEKKLFKEATNPKSDLESVPCAGEAADGSDAKPFHPKKIRGTVYAPFGTYAQRAPSTPWWLSTAHAHPLPQEKPIVDIEVTLFLIDSTGVTVRDNILKTRTDAKGRYCFRIPDDIKLSPMLIASAGENKTLMRRNIVSRSTNDIFLQPEALFRILVAQKIDFSRLPRSEFGNLYSMTDTVVDDQTHPKPLSLSKGMSIAPGVVMVQKRLMATERFTTKLGALQKKFGR